MRDAAYAGLRGQRVGRRSRGGRRRRRSSYSALHDQRPLRFQQRAAVRQLSAAATMPLPRLRGARAGFARHAAGRGWFAALVRELQGSGRRGAAAAGRWARRVPMPLLALLVASALAAAAVVKVVVPTLAELGSSSEGAALRQVLVDNLATIGAAAPPAASTAGAADAPAGTWSRVRYQRYQAGAGDTLAGLADRFGITVDTIISFNDLKQRDLKTGRELIIPNQSGIRYTVRSGDEPGRIAARHGVSLPALLAVNEVEGGLVAPGQSLMLPGAGLSETARNRVLGELFVKPARGQVASGYGYRTDPFTGLRKFHNGIDITNQAGTPIVAAMSGTVDTAGYNGNYGRYLILRHADGYQTLYAHLSKVLVSAGDRVRQGQRVGAMGNTGYSSAVNLHFSIFHNGAHVDPSEHLE